MKKLFFRLILLSFVIISCNSTKTVVSKSATLEGSWQLNYITGPRIAFDGLYPNNKPTIVFDLKQNRVSGTNSCNSYGGNLLIDSNKINFKEAKMFSTMMACQGEGEQVFMSTLEKINTYTISEDGKTLNFIMGDIAMMRFEKVTTNAHNSQNALDWQGTYKGTTPCADCVGIETNIILNKDLTFIIKTKYLGKGDGEIFEERGSFSWDNSGLIISLKDLKGKPNQYKVGENRLTQLDVNGEIITGNLATMYILKK